MMHSVREPFSCCSERSLEELEARHSDLRRELVAAKEAVSQVTLQKDVLEDEKRSLAAALSKVAGHCSVSHCCSKT